MANLDSIRYFPHTVTMTADDETPCVVTLRRMTVSEWMSDLQRQADFEAATAKVGTDLLPEIAKAGSTPSQVVQTAAIDAGRRMLGHADDAIDYLTSLVTAHCQDVAGLDGWEDDGFSTPIDALLSFRPVLLELATSLREQSTVSEALGK